MSERESVWRQYRDLPAAVHALCLGTLVNRAGTFLIPFLTLYLRQELGLSISTATRAMGAFGAGAIVASLVGGHLADLLGRRVIMLASLIGGAIVLVLFGTLRSPGAVVAAVFAFALLADMYKPAASAMIADLVGPARRAQAYGLLHVAINLGWTIGAAAGGVIAKYSFQWLFWGDALTACACALLFLAVIPETLPSRSQTGASGPPPRSLAAAAAAIAGDRVFVVYCVATVLGATVFLQLMSSLPLQLAQHGIGSHQYGLLVSVNAGMIVLLQLLVTARVARYDRGRILATSAMLIAIGYGIVGLSTQLWQFVLVIVALTVGELMQAPLVRTIVGDLAPPDMRGRYMGVLSVCFGIALMIGAPLGGWVLEHVGSAALWSGCFVAGTMSAVTYYAIRRGIAAGDPGSRTGEP